MSRYETVWTGGMAETVRISGDVFLRMGNLPVRDQCNTGILVDEEGLVLVDLPAQEPDEEILEEAEAYFGKKVTHLMITHAHGDHRKGLATLHRRDLTVISSRESREEIRNCYPSFEPENWITVKSGDVLTIHRRTCGFWIPERLPAHSPWDLCIRFPREDLVFTGDFIVPPFFLYTYSSSWRNWVQALGQFTRSHGESLLVTGHGLPERKEKLVPLLERYLSLLGEAAGVVCAGQLSRISREPEEKLPDCIREAIRLSDPDTVFRQIREIHESGF